MRLRTAERQNIQRRSSRKRVAVDRLAARRDPRVTPVRLRRVMREHVRFTPRIRSTSRLNPVVNRWDIRCRGMPGQGLDAAGVRTEHHGSWRCLSFLG